MMPPKRLRRCQLSVPGSNERLVASGLSCAVDYIFFDLEDAVAPKAKAAARARVIEAVCSGKAAASTVAVRINELTSEWALDDVVGLVEGCGNALDVIIVPKVRTAADVVFIDRLLTLLENRAGLSHRIGLEVLIEEIEALMDVERIASASSRLEALIFGMGDYAASQGILTSSVGETDDYPGDLFHYHRNRVIIAARANKLVAIDGPYADFRNDDKFLTEARRAAILGFSGKWAIHPLQIALAERVFSPDPAMVIRARAIKSAYDVALANGEGAIQFEGKMIDVASVRAVEDLIERSTIIEARALSH
jgi:citrate lyase subunit beta/citryl-CoA lyase